MEAVDLPTHVLTDRLRERSQIVEGRPEELHVPHVRKVAKLRQIVKLPSLASVKPAATVS